MKTIYFRHNNYSQCPPTICPGIIATNELTFVTKGELTYEINGKKFTISKGDAICVPACSLRARPSDQQADYFSFNFIEKDFNKFPILIKDCISNEINLLLHSCEEIYLKNINWEDKINIALALIILLIESNFFELKCNPVINEIKRYIKDNLNNKLTLRNIAEKVGYSPNYCDSLFKKETGESIINYLIKERINEAKRLLIERTLTIKEIALFVGFEDYNYFSRTFKKITGVSPTEYKNL